MPLQNFFSFRLPRSQNDQQMTQTFVRQILKFMDKQMQIHFLF